MKKILMQISPVALFAVALFVLAGGVGGRSISVELATADPVAEAIDEARYTTAMLLGSQVDFPRPAAEAESNLKTLVEANASEPRYYDELAEVQVALGKYDDAVATMQRMAEAHPEPTKGLAKLADFYHQRLMIHDEAAALMNLADKQGGDEKIATLRRVLQLGQDFLLDSVNDVALHLAMRDEKPDDANLVGEYIAALRRAEQYDAALAEVNAALEKFADSQTRFLSLKAEVLQAMGRTDEALAVFDIDYDPVEDVDIFNSYMSHLRSAGRFTRFERGLRRDFRLGQLDERGFQRFFLLMRTQRNFNDAAKGLEKWMESLGSMSADRLGVFADAYIAIGYPVPAWRIAYARYITAPESGKGAALYQLTTLTKAAAGRGLQLGSGTGLILSNRHFDTGPGILGGLLSMLYNGSDVGRKFEDLDRMSKDYAVHRAYFSLFEKFETEYPESEHLGALYADAIEILNSYGRAREAFELAERFMNDQPEAEKYYDVAEAAITSLTTLKLNDRIEALYKELIARADLREETSRYNTYLSRLERHYVQQKLLDRGVAFYWEQINAHPEREQLYNSFLQYLSRHRIFAEEMKVYQRAIQQFKTNDYYDKLARWYLRNKRNDEFRELTRDIADIFGDSELAEYFRQHLNTARNASDADSVFYRTMYEYANKRFPRNLRFVNGLLNYYSRFKLWTEFDALSMRYFYADATIRKNWLWRLSARKGMLPVAEQLLGLDLASTIDAAAEGTLPESPAEVLFVAEAAQWNSYFEAAEAPLKAMAERYPTQMEYVEALAMLERSLGNNEDAIQLYTTLAKRDPYNAAYLTSAGEIAVEQGDIATASGFWEGLIAAKPADSDVYLQVASIFWDYYQFDRAADILLQGRERLKSPGLYSAKLGAVYESAGDYEAAIDDYINSIVLNWDDYYGREQPMSRLVYLATRKKMDDAVAKAFETAVSGSENYHTVQAYDDFLTRLENRGKTIENLRAAVGRYDESEFLTWIAARFRTLNQPDLEKQAIERYIRIDGEAPENLLLLAQYYERQKQLDAAERVYLQRVEMTRTEEPEALPDYVAALQDAANFAWRHERFDAAFERWETAARASEDWRQRSQMLELVNRLVLKERYEKAMALLNEMLAADPTNAQLFNSLAGIYAKRDDYRGLAELYKQAIETVRKADNLGAEQRKFRVRQLRFGMIENLKRLGDITAAVDQYIELINGEHDDYTTIAGAYRLAARNNLTERLIGYYQDTSEKSFKDYRWNTVLARLAELENDLETADAQWRKAIANEPQRINLRQALAEVLTKRQLFDGAVEQYREIYRLDQRNSFWLNRIAETQAMAGDIEAAKETLATILENSPNEYSNYFDAARFLNRWGDLEAAAEYMTKGLEVFKADIYKERLSQEDLNLFLEVGVKRGEAVATFNELLALNLLFGREAGRSGNANAWQARSGQTMTFNAFSGSLAEAVRNYANSEETAAVAAVLDGFINSGAQNRGTLDWVLNTAKAMNMQPTVEKAFETRFALVLDKFRDYDSDNMFNDMLEYYRDRGMWDEAAAALESEMARMDMRNFKTTVNAWLADIYRYSGNAGKEREALQRYWDQTSNGSAGFSSESEYARRYIELLMDEGNDTTLRSLAGNAGKYAGFALNYFLSHERIDLAVVCIDAISRNYGPKWRDSKKLLLDVYAGASPDELGVYGLPTDLMDHKPISRRLGVAPDSQRVFVGDEWYQFLPHYAEYLLLEKEAKDINAWVNGIAEMAPRNPEAQRAAGRWHTRHERWDDAMRHFGLAQQLAPNDLNNYVAVGEMRLKQGNKNAALAEWGKIIAGTGSPDAYQLYLNTLVNADMLDRAAPAFEEFIRNEFDEGYNWAVLSLLSEYVELLQEKGDAEPVARLIVEVSKERNNPLQFLSQAYEQLTFEPDNQAILMEALIEAARSSDPEATPEQQKMVHKNWLEQGIQFAMENQQWSRALGWIDAYESEGYDESPGWQVRSKQNLMCLRGKALLALDRKAEALVALQASLEGADDFDIDPYRQVYTILSQGGAEAEGRGIMIRFYRNALSRGMNSTDVYTGLADMLLAEGGNEERQEATAVLDRFVNRTVDNADALSKAAEILEKHELSGSAMRYRRMLLSVAPTNHANVLSLAMGQIETGDRTGAIELLRRLYQEPGVEKKLLVDAADPYAKLFEGRAAEAREEMGLYADRIDASETHRLLTIYLALAANEMGRARELLNSGDSQLYQAALMAREEAEFALRANNTADAIRWLQKSISRKPYPESWTQLARLLLANEKESNALLLFDTYNWQGLNAGETSQIEMMTGLHGKDLLAFLNDLIDAAIVVEEFDTASMYDSHRTELAYQLGIEVKSRNEEIERLQKEHAPPPPPIRIEQSIANATTGEGR